MEISMQTQALTFLLSIALGVLYGVLYDVIRFLRVVFFVDVRSPFRARAAKRGARNDSARGGGATVRTAPPPGTAPGRAAAPECADAQTAEKPCKKKRGVWFGYLFVAVGDFLFFVLAAILMCVFFFVMSDGQVRGFALLGAFLGFLVYYNTIGRLFIGICAWLANLVKRACIALFRLLFRGLRLALSPLARLLRALGGFLQKIAVPIVRRLAARYNKYKVGRTLEKARRAQSRRMKRCGSVCRNNINGN